MQYLVVSFSHKNTDLQTREKLALNDEKTREAVYKKLIQNSVINELIILSTCNRVELIASVKDPFKSSDLILEELSKISGIDFDELEGRADIYEDNGAIHHIFSVASALDSLVIGETQISGQLKDAFKEAFEKGYASQKLARVMHFAFKCAAEVRNSTDISKSPVSIASAAVAQAKDIFENLGGMSALVLGTGEMGKLAAKHLISNGCNVILIGRNIEKTKRVAKDLGENVEAQSIENLKNLINRYRLLFSATSSKEPVITKDMVEEKDFNRYWFDMAVPRDIDDFYIENIKVFVVDDLKAIVNKSLALREAQAKEAYRIVGKYTKEFFKWLQTLSIEPIIKGIREKAKEASISEIKKAIKKGYIPKELEENVTKILHNAFNRFLHSPTKNIKAIADDPSGDTIIESVKYLFDLNGEEYNHLNRYKCEYYMNMIEGENSEIQ
ncbi:glutamyl-tRNA reductase [Nitrosophilus kaiyonis]|uniref:glutamyl-tRNA reductase n=1 Tax=Nitrosophilus kaiyonis TaxID=2930200 RepID=UPI002491E234|nr:glutamyl-tRNA reductase [Nitrosophilus kaiyonis]